MIKCNNCEEIYLEPRVWPIKCICGQVIHQDGTYTKFELQKSKQYVNSEEYPCKFRNEEVGHIDCGCLGNKSVYNCEIQGMCAIRKLKPGTPRIKLNDETKITQDISYCNSCDKRVEP